MDRTEEIRKNLKAKTDENFYGCWWEQRAATEEIPYLLQRIDDLKDKLNQVVEGNERLADQLIPKDERIRELERENEKLRNDMLTARLDYERW